MTTDTQIFLLRLAALALAAALLLTDRLVPDELWAASAGLWGLATRRPGDTSPTELARVLEQHDPTITRRPPHA